MKMKEIMKNFFADKNILPPLTIKKIENAGCNVSSFLLELRQEMLKADDIKYLTKSQKKHIDNFLTACKDLMTDE